MAKRILTALAVILTILQFNSIPVLGEASAGDTSQIPALKAESAVLMDASTGRVLFEKDSHKRMHPASIAKVLTAILVMENIDMDETITVGREINLAGEGSSGAGLTVGETISGRDLIWALMLPAGNDAAYTAAVTIAGKKSGSAAMDAKDAVAYFTGLMNKRAQEIGAGESNFKNPDGYPEENNYSTAGDLALIVREALKNDFFKEVVSTYSYTVKNDAASQTSSKSKKGPAEWVNINQLINPDSKYYYKYATGVKTGYTSAAGYCLAASAVKDDLELVSVILKDSTEEARWVDSTALFEYGFAEFKYHTLMKKGESAGSIKVVRKYLNDVMEINALASEDYTGLFTDKEFNNIKQEIKWDSSLAMPAVGKNNEARLAGPVKSGQVLGTVVYSLDGNVLAESQLTADRDSKKGNYTDTVYVVLDRFVTYKYIFIPVCIVVLAAIILIILRRILKRRIREQ